MYEVLTKNEDINGNVFYLFQTNCFSLCGAKRYIKKRGNRSWHYVIKHNGNITHECRPNCFAAKPINNKSTDE